MLRCVVSTHQVVRDTYRNTLSSGRNPSREATRSNEARTATYTGHGYKLQLPYLLHTRQLFSKFRKHNVLLPVGQYTLKDENGLLSDSFTLVYNRVFGNPANPHNGDVYARIGNFVSDEGDVSPPEDEFFDQHSGPVVKPFDSPLGIGGISNFAVSIPSDSSITISSPREFSALEHGTTGILLGVGMVFLMVVRKTWFKDFGT